MATVVGNGASFIVIAMVDSNNGNRPSDPPDVKAVTSPASAVADEAADKTDDASAALATVVRIAPTLIINGLPELADPTTGAL